MTTATLDNMQARGALLETLIAKAREACFVDWCVGLCLLLFYGKAAAAGTLFEVSLWPLIGALACTRAGDTIKGVAKTLRGSHAESV